MPDFIRFDGRTATPLKLIFPAADANSLSLLAAMFVLDPRRRLSPTAALETHAFFTSCTEKQQRENQAGAATRIQTLPSAHARGVATTKRGNAPKRSSTAEGGNVQRRARLGDEDDSDDGNTLLMDGGGATGVDLDDNDDDGVRKKLEL